MRYFTSGSAPTFRLVGLRTRKHRDRQNPRWLTGRGVRFLYTVCAGSGAAMFVGYRLLQNRNPHCDAFASPPSIHPFFIIKQTTKQSSRFPSLIAKGNFCDCCHKHRYAHPNWIEHRLSVRYPAGQAIQMPADGFSVRFFYNRTPRRQPVRHNSRKINKLSDWREYCVI